MKRLVVVYACVVFFVASGCGRQSSVLPENDDCHAELGYGARIKLKPQVDKSYCPTEDPEIKALLSKHGLGMRQTMPRAKNPELLLYYSITIEDSRECRENYIKDF